MVSVNGVDCAFKIGAHYTAIPGDLASPKAASGFRWFGCRPGVWMPTRRLYPYRDRQGAAPWTWNRPTCESAGVIA